MMHYSPANSSISALCWVFQRPVEKPEFVLQQDRRRGREGHRGCASQVRCSLSRAFEYCIYRPLTEPPFPSFFRISVGFYLFSAPLNNLNISYNSIGVEGAGAIAAALPR